METAIQSPDPAVREAIPVLVSAAASEMDLRPFADLFEQACRVRKACFWTKELQDWSALRFDPRPVRLDLLERVIRSGTVTLPGGYPVSRSLAIQMAALQGLDELRPLAGEYLATLTDRYRDRLQLDDAMALFELTAGAETEMDAAFVAARRLDAMSDQELGRRMDEEPFRKAVILEVQRACRVDALTGVVLPACGRYAFIAERQKRRFPGSSFSDGCMMIEQQNSLPKWLDALHLATRGQAPTEPPAETAELPAERSARPGGLDPCGLPELPPNWTQGWYEGKYFVVLTDQSRDRSEVSVADGVLHHAPGEKIRLKIDIRDRLGARPTFPVAMKIRLSGKSIGRLSPAGKLQECGSLNLFWNRAASEGASLVDFDEIDFTLGPSAEIAGLVPGPIAPATNPVWKTTERLEIQFGELKDGGGTLTREGGAVYDVRPEGASVPDRPPRPFDVLLSRPAGALEAEFFGPELQTDQIVVTEPRRQYVALIDRDRTEPTRPVLCFSQRENGTRVTQAEPVVFRRLAETPVFVGSFIALPEGHPDAQTVPGRTLLPPVVVIPLGAGSIGCEDPPSESTN